MRLSAEQRRRLPSSDFAIPEKAPGPGSFPLNNKGHAQAALRLAHNASPEDQARIKRKVAAEYPSVKQGAAQSFLRHHRSKSR